MTAELLRELVELTPLPPQTADVEELLRAFTEMFEARQTWIDAHPPTALETDEARAIAREVSARNEAWQRALRAASNAIGQSRHNATRLRAYHR
ncbi:MAG: hypothetical protein ACKV2T_22715 [Kofleriaceae bacterium]